MNRLRLVLILFVGMMLLTGCNKWSEPEFIIEDWDDTDIKPNQFWTIKDVIEKHINGNSPDTLITTTKIRYIRAVVVSSDEGGNCYKYMVVQDSTGAVAIQLDLTGIYTRYPVGQKIVLVCNGLQPNSPSLMIGDYHNLPQIGWMYQGGVGRINSLFIDHYIIRDGMPSLKNIPKPLTNNEINFDGDSDLNKLVCLEGVKFEPEAIGKQLAFNDFTTDWKIKVPLANGTTKDVTVRTSNYAKFRSMIIQNKEYNLTGIFTKYNNSYQLVIRIKEDIVASTNSEEIVEFDFAQNPIGEGKWSNHSQLGSNTLWAFRSSSMMHYGHELASYQIAMDDWLISPIIEYNDLENGYMRFNHQLNVTIPNYDAYQVYYTTSTAETFNIADWKSLGALSSFPATSGWSNIFHLKNINANKFRIAFRYNAPNPDVTVYQWKITKVEFRNK